MNKRELIDRVAGATGLSKADTRRTLNAALEIAADTLISGEQIFLRGFGTMFVRSRNKRTVYNIGGVSSVPERRIAMFRAGESLKKAINKEGL